MSDILIIDNDYEDILLLNTILREAGFSVRTARTGAGGLRAAYAIRPNLVLLDVLLPDQDGFRICEELHSNPALTNVPIIFISALQDAALKAQAFEIGAGDFIVKPYHPKEIVVRVEHQLALVQLRERMTEDARQKERQHIARELHDSVSQSLFILSASLESLLLATPIPSENLRQQIQDIHRLSQSTMAEMRTLLYELRPRQIDAASMNKLLYQLADAFRLRVNGELIIMADECELPNDIKLAFYRITQEALNNIIKHSRAGQVMIRFTAQDGIYRLVVTDDGRGFDSVKSGTGMGLHTMRERAEELRIQLEITSALGQGTQVAAVWYEHALPR